MTHTRYRLMITIGGLKMNDPWKDLRSENAKYLLADSRLEKLLADADELLAFKNSVVGAYGAGHLGNLLVAIEDALAVLSEHLKG